LSTPYDNILLSGTSPTQVNTGATVTLDFTETFIDIDSISAGDYPVQVDLFGISTGATYSQTIDAGQLTIGSGVVFFSGGNVTPEITLRGQGPVLAEMYVGNNGVPLPIDSTGTTLLFKYSSIPDSLIIPQPIVIRTDSLDTLEISQNNRLTFEFDVPIDFPLEQIDVYGRISLDNAALERESVAPIAGFEVFTGAALKYVPGSLSSTQVVPRQEVSFSIRIADTLESGLTLDPNQSYVQIVGASVDTAWLASNYIIPPNDTSQISFESITIPLSIATDTSYSLIARIAGFQVNGDTLIDTLTLEPLEILTPADVTVAGINIIPSVVRQNQAGVEVEYTLRNDGSSPAFIRSLLPRFTRSRDSRDVSANWVLSSITPELQDTLGVNNSRILNAEYVLSAQADTGVIIPGHGFAVKA
jgi:hypothetical protein